MRMTFRVGQVEQHEVAFSFDKMWGGRKIEVDGVSVMDDVLLLSLSLTKVWEFPVGTTEVHQVRIEHHRPLVFSFARRQPIKAFVDGQLVAEDAA